MQQSLTQSLFVQQIREGKGILYKTKINYMFSFFFNQGWSIYYVYFSPSCCPFWHVFFLMASLSLGVSFTNSLCVRRSRKHKKTVDHWRQFHQRFSRAFLHECCFQKLFLRTYVHTNVEKKLPKQHLYKKACEKHWWNWHQGVSFAHFRDLRAQKLHVKFRWNWPLMSFMNEPWYFLSFHLSIRSFLFLHQSWVNAINEMLSLKTKLVLNF